MVRLKRAYEPEEDSDGERILVDRLWPRGVRKENAHFSEWMKDLAPSDALRKWFGHDPDKWEDFRRRYREELGEANKKELLGRLAGKAREHTITLVYAARDEKCNQAVVIKELLEEG